MTKVKVSEAIELQLDWMVAKAENIEVEHGCWNTLWRCDKDVFGARRCVQGDEGVSYHPSRDWSQGGPIIEREKIDLQAKINAGSDYNEWLATIGVGAKQKRCYGPTPLVAAMRCYVVSKLGKEVEVPEELS